MKIPYSTTTIPPERTKADIEKLLHEHGIQDVQWTTYQGKTTLKFIWKVTLKDKETGTWKEKEIMFSFQPPQIPVQKRTWTGMRYEKVTVNLEATAYRLLWHYLKNKLEAVTWGLISMEKEFLSQAVVALPDGSVTTVGDRIQDVYEAVKQPSLEFQPVKNDELVTIDVPASETEENDTNEENSCK